MEFVAFIDDGVVMMGVLDTYERVIPLTDIDRFYEDVGGWLTTAGDATKGHRDLATLVQRPPVPAGARVICIGLNYFTHAIEANLPVPEHVMAIGRWSASLAADGDTVPAVDDNFDWEGELAVIVGSSVFRVSEEAAADAIFGFAAFNDFSARSLQTRTPQWTLGKNSDRSGPLGAIRARDEAFSGTEALSVRTLVNGEIVQDGTTGDLIFNVARLISELSHIMTLHPGDVIATGTPAGVGAMRKPPRFLKPGDQVAVEISGLRPLRNQIIAQL